MADDGSSFDLPRWHNPADMAFTGYGGGGGGAGPGAGAAPTNSLSRSTSLRDNSYSASQSPPSPAHLDPYNYYQPRYPHSRSHSQQQQQLQQHQQPLSPSSPSAYYHLDTATAPAKPSPPSPMYHPMNVDKREVGLRRIRNPAQDLKPNPNIQPYVGRPSQDNSGQWLGPLSLLTTNLVQTYARCNPAFHYESTHNPRRVLTKPSKPMHNEGYDNEDYDYILYVNDWLGVEEGHKYLILDILGQGTFGQVVKCQNMKTHEIVAVKVVKNKPAYFNQSMMEVTILELLNKQADPNDAHHILRLRDSFIHRSHLCLVFELLSSNLYELIKQNQFQGLSTQLVKVFMAQLLDALSVLKEQRLIHCDLKPENILLKSLQSPQIKVIDFGSACHERQTVYTYIQSRFYRSPEVLLGMGYNAAIDMWSLGCIAVELFLGLPLFPGTSEYNQLTRIVDMLGLPPLSMLNQGKQTNQFFDHVEVYNPHLNTNEKKYRLKSLEQYSREHGTNEQPGKQYFKARTLPDIVNQAPMPPSNSKSKGGNEVEKEMNARASFIDFCKGLLDMNPVTRWTPQQARQHPFITGEKFTKPFVPGGAPSPQPPVSASPGASSNSSQQDTKRPYGGLVPSQPKGTRAYQDAATYNQQLAQHQAYTAQAQAQNTYTRNPYMAPSNNITASAPVQAGSQTMPMPRSQPQTPSGNAPTSAPPFPQADPAAPPVSASSNQNYGNAGGHRLTHQSSHGQLSAYSTAQAHPPSLAPHLNPPNISVSTSGSSSASTGQNAAAAAANAYYTPPQSSSQNARARANTIGNNNNPPDSGVPPALARLQHMNADILQGGRNALTPVLNRDDAMREWERRQGRGVGPGSGQPMYSNPQLEYLAQQAEIASATGMNWNQLHPTGPPQPVRYPPATVSQAHHHQPSKLAHSYQPEPTDVTMSDGRRDVVMSNVRAAAASSASSGGAGAYRNALPSSSATSAAPVLIQSPPQAYNASGGSTSQAAIRGYAPPTAAQQYAQSVMQHQHQPPSATGSTPFDSPISDSRGRADLYIPMQPEQYQGAGVGSPYASPSAPRGGQLPPPSQQQQQQQQQNFSAQRRQSGMEWPH